MTSLPVWVKRRHIGLCKIRKSADAKKVILRVHLNNVVLNFTEIEL